MDKISFKEATDIISSKAKTIGTEELFAIKAVGRVAVSKIVAVADSPNVNASLKDGYAVISEDISKASADNRIKLDVIGSVSAGSKFNGRLKPGQAVRILTGAPLPEGAEAVLTEELANICGDHIYALADANPGRNVLEKGADVLSGDVLVEAGQKLTPEKISLLVAGGIFQLSVYKKPRIGLLATGTEIIRPGSSISAGKIYASNVACQESWLSLFGFDCTVLFSEDSTEMISESILKLYESCDIVITSGGAWKGERDLIASVIKLIGGEMLFHRLRMGPGKAAGMGIFKNKPFFCLPGGPSSNYMAFVMLVLPAVFKMAGFKNVPLLHLEGEIEREITGQARWTNLFECVILKNGSKLMLRPQKLKSRLLSMSKCNAIVLIPEGVEKISAGETVSFICLNAEQFHYYSNI